MENHVTKSNCSFSFKNLNCSILTSHFKCLLLFKHCIAFLKFSLYMLPVSPPPGSPPYGQDLSKIHSDTKLPGTMTAPCHPPADLQSSLNALLLALYSYRLYSGLSRGFSGIHSWTRSFPRFSFFSSSLPIVWLCYCALHFVFEAVLLLNPWCPLTLNPPASTSQLLGLQACATTKDTARWVYYLPGPRLLPSSQSPLTTFFLVNSRFSSCFIANVQNWI